jgi:hypothetical protein
VTLTAYGDGLFGAGTYGGVTVRADPSWVVEVYDPTAGWVDRTCDVRAVEVDAGRAAYVDAFDAATATVTFANPAGVYSAYPPTSIWLQPDGYVTGVPIRCGSVVAGTVEWRFTGTTDAVDDTWPGTIDAVATVRASDGLAGLARHNGGPRAAVGAGELTGARINRLADDGAWTAARRVDVGVVPLVATTLDGTTIDLMRATGESEWGWLYVAGDGALVFRQRDAVTTDPRMSTVQYLFTDSDAVVGACYGAATVAADNASIVNVAQVTVAGVVQSYTDPGSLGHFGPRTWTRTDLPIRDAVDGAALAQLVVLTYRRDDQAINAVSIDAVHHPTNVAAAHGARITDRIRFVRTYPGGHQLDAELLVQGRHDVVTPAGDGYALAQWDVTFQTASALLIVGLGAWDVGLWDDAKWGV